MKIPKPHQTAAASRATAQRKRVNRATLRALAPWVQSLKGLGQDSAKAKELDAARAERRKNKAIIGELIRAGFDEFPDSALVDAFRSVEYQLDHYATRPRRLRRSKVREELTLVRSGAQELLKRLDGLSSDAIDAIAPITETAIPKATFLSTCRDLQVALRAVDLLTERSIKRTPPDKGGRPEIARREQDLFFTLGILWRIHFPTVARVGIVAGDEGQRGGRMLDFVVGILKAAGIKGLPNKSAIGKRLYLMKPYIVEATKPIGRRTYRKPGHLWPS